MLNLDNQLCFNSLFLLYYISIGSYTNKTLQPHVNSFSPSPKHPNNITLLRISPKKTPRKSQQPAILLGAALGGLSAWGQHNWAAPARIPFSLTRVVVPAMAAGAAIGLVIGSHYPEKFNTIPTYFDLKPLVREEPPQ